MECSYGLEKKKQMQEEFEEKAEDSDIPEQTHTLARSIRDTTHRRSGNNSAERVTRKGREGVGTVHTWQKRVTLVLD